MSIKMYVPANLSCQQEEDLGGAVVKRAKDILVAEGIQPPKKIGYIGCYGSWISFSFNRNVVKGALVQALEEQKLSYTVTT